MIPRRDAEVTVSVPQGGGNSDYTVSIKGERLDVLKAICDIYGGYLVSYDADHWFDKPEGDKVNER